MSQNFNKIKHILDYYTFNQKTIMDINKTLLYISEQEKNLKDIENIKNELNNDYFLTNNKVLKDNSTNNANNVTEF